MRCFFGISLLFCPFSPILLAEKIILSPGELAFIPRPTDQKIRIGDKSLLSFRAEQGQISLLARKRGQSLLVAGNKKYEIFVLEKEKKQKAIKLDQLLNKMWGLSWSLSSQSIFQITGRLNRLHDYVDLAELSQSLNILYEFKALPGEGLKPSIKQYFKKIFKNQILPEFIWGEQALAYTPKGADLSYYKNILRPFGLTPKEDPLWFFKNPFIEIEIALVEILNSSSFSFKSQDGGFDQVFLKNWSSLLGFLNFLKSSGYGKSLHHSSIIAQSGQSLKIHSGGQIPFHNYNTKTEQSSAQWKSHGLQLHITPTVGKRDHILLTIKAQLSEPLPQSFLSGPPPLKNQSWESQIVLKNRQILKLFHLKKQAQGKQNNSQIGWLNSLTYSLFGGSGQHKMSQFVFIQARIKK